MPTLYYKYGEEYVLFTTNPTFIPSLKDEVLILGIVYVVVARRFILSPNQVIIQLSTL